MSRFTIVENPTTQEAFVFGAPRVIQTEREAAAEKLDAIIRSHTQPTRSAAWVDKEIARMEAGLPAYEYSKRFRPGANKAHRGAFFDGTHWVRAKPRKKAAAKKGRAKPRRRGVRDSRGRFLPARKKASARRAAPARKKRAAARRAPRLGRDSRGRFLKKGAKRRSSRARRLPPMSRTYVARARKRKGVRKHMRARRLIRPGMKIAGLVRINPRTGAITMSRAKVANPRKKHRKHRRPSRARRTSNPGTSLMATAKAAIGPMAAGAGAGALAGYIDTKFLATRPTLSVLAKLGLGIAGVAVLRRKHPTLGMGFAGGMLGATGYTYGVKFAGGHVALNGIQGLRGLADMAASDPETANLIAGLQDVVPDQMGDGASDYNDALADNADSVADIVED